LQDTSVGIELPKETLTKSESSQGTSTKTGSSEKKNDNIDVSSTFSSDDTSSEIKPFGYKFLTKTVSRRDNISVVMDDYLIKPGDELIIDIWGDINLHYKLPVSKDGFIDIERVGRVYIRGMKYIDAKTKILRALGKTYELFINSESSGAGSSLVDISLGKSVGLILYVTGAVKKPGSIHVNSTSASVLNALIKAGGVNKSGSLRNIKISKSSYGENLPLDLYDFFLNGKFKNEFKYLNDGDIIFVPYKGRTVSIDGGVHNPSIFELLPDENIDSLIEYAGGFKPDAIKLEIRRKKEDISVLLKNIDKNKISEAINKPLMDGDKIYIYVSKEIMHTDFAIVKGNVNNPGRKEIYPDITLEEIIMLSGGFKDEADISNIEIIRDITNDSSDKSKIIKIDFANVANKKFKLKKNDIIDVRLEYNLVNQDIVNVTGFVNKPGIYTLMENETLKSIIERAGNVKYGIKEGKIELIRDHLASSFPISKVICEAQREFTVQLRPNDKINIIPKEPWVTVEGNVQKPGRYVYEEGQDYQYYFTLAGGAKHGKSISKVIIKTLEGDIIDGNPFFWSNPNVPMDSKISFR
jgi:protein involved in polysaccharide export with SLBB domain